MQSCRIWRSMGALESQPYGTVTRTHSLFSSEVASGLLGAPVLPQCPQRGGLEDQCALCPTPTRISPPPPGQGVSSESSIHSSHLINSFCVLSPVGNVRACSLGGHKTSLVSPKRWCAEAHACARCVSGQQ